ncbi:MAG: OmpA family protein [Paludibacteraceae bacterium]|nr:OmpA family protein [Paludibacteraceae bacterium]
MKMKQGITALLLLCLTMNVMAQQGRVKGAHPYKLSENKRVATKLSRVSLTPHFGFNYLDGDFHNEMKSQLGWPCAAFDIEYSFSPVWGLGVNYTFDRYGVTGNPEAGNHADTLLNGYLHKAGGFVSMDFMGLFYPAARRRIFSAEFIAGAGFAWYKRLLYYPDNTRQHTSLLPPSGPDEKYNSQMFLQAGFNFEFNLNRTLALGVRGTYTYFVNDYIDGRGFEGPVAIASKNNDGLVDVTLNMRFKLAAVSKTHVRNMNVRQYDKLKDGGDGNGDGKAAVHDTIIIRRDSIIVREVVDPSASSSTNTSSSSERWRETNQYYYVYFETGKADLVDNGLATIQQVADRMEEDTALYAVVVGYCDNTGTNSLNYTLGDSRADNVIDELRAEHGIDGSRIYSTGLGKLIGRRSTASYSPNRRASIRLVDRATFERMKKDLDEKKTHRDGTKYVITENETIYQSQPSERIHNVNIVNTVPLNESARPERVNPFANRNSITVEVEDQTTLAKLARQYYNNTHCWVYLYIANMEQLPNPNALEPGMELIVPELTADEMRITKDQCLDKYYETRRNR